MFVRWAERFPGGRLLVLGLPLLMLLFGIWLMDPFQLTQVSSAVILVLTLVGTWHWRKALPIYFRERENAGLIWFNLGFFMMFIVTVSSIGYTLVMRHIYGPDVDLLWNYVPAIFRYGYAFAFGCWYLVPLARGPVIPPRGWVSLMGLVLTTAVAAYFLLT
jgi:hypothetical protein